MRMVGIALLLALLVVCPAYCGAPGAKIECFVVYKYADGTIAQPNEVWEKGWKWKIEGTNAESLILKSATFNRATFVGPLKDATKYTIRLTNDLDQNCAVSFTYRKRQTTTKLSLVKKYSKVFLLDNQGKVMKGDVYLGPSGISDAMTLKHSHLARKCPAALNGGVSVPPIENNPELRFSLYSIDKYGIKEFSFTKHGWYGKPGIRRLVID